MQWSRYHTQLPQFVRNSAKIPIFRALVELHCFQTLVDADTIGAWLEKHGHEEGPYALRVALKRYSDSGLVTREWDGVRFLYAPNKTTYKTLHYYEMMLQQQEERKEPDDLGDAFEKLDLVKDISELEGSVSSLLYQGRLAEARDLISIYKDKRALELEESRTIKELQSKYPFARYLRTARMIRKLRESNSSNRDLNSDLFPFGPISYFAPRKKQQMDLSKKDIAMDQAATEKESQEEKVRVFQDQQRGLQELSDEQLRELYLKVLKSKKSIKSVKRGLSFEAKKRGLKI